MCKCLKMKRIRLYKRDLIFLSLINLAEGIVLIWFSATLKGDDLFFHFVHAIDGVFCIILALCCLVASLFPSVRGCCVTLLFMIFAPYVCVIVRMKLMMSIILCVNKSTLFFTKYEEEEPRRTHSTRRTSDIGQQRRAAVMSQQMRAMQATFDSFSTNIEALPSYNEVIQMKAFTDVVVNPYVERE